MYLPSQSTGIKPSQAAGALATLARRPLEEHFGVSVHPTNVAYWPIDGGYMCAGFWDCINMINSEKCQEVKCVTGWVTGEPVCTCST
jgi:hypothetical protein